MRAARALAQEMHTGDVYEGVGVPLVSCGGWTMRLRLALPLPPPPLQPLICGSSFWEGSKSSLGRALSKPSLNTQHGGRGQTRQRRSWKLRCTSSAPSSSTVPRWSGGRLATTSSASSTPLRASLSASSTSSTTPSRSSRSVPACVFVYRLLCWMVMMCCVHTCFVCVRARACVCVGFGRAVFACLC